MSFRKPIIFSLFILLIFTACRHDDEPIVYNQTVLVYMVANNSLSSEVTANVDSMEAGLSHNKIDGNLLIYLDKGTQPELLQLVRDNHGTVTEKIIKTYTDQNSVSPTIMTSILNDVKNRYPSLNYGLVLWSHGDGWIPPTNTKALSTRWFGQDGNNFMDIPDLVIALNGGPHFKFILFDACFMSGVETAYALRNNTDYLIASPSEVLADGFPYGQIISSMFGSNESDCIKTASTFYNYYNQQSGYMQSGSVGCIKCSELENLAAVTKQIITAHATDVNNINATNIQHLEGYSPHLFYDFGHFIDSFATSAEQSTFDAQLSKTVVYKASTPNILSVPSAGWGVIIPVSHFCGMNTFIPQSTTQLYNTEYHNTAWYTAAGWDKTNW
jgi:hypothetical protein